MEKLSTAPFSSLLTSSTSIIKLLVRGVLLLNVSRTLATTYSPPCGVPSAQEGLTSVFGMGTGVAPPINHQRSRYVRYNTITYEKCVGSKQNKSDIQNSAPETGHISTSRLNTLLCVHLKPINLIISKVSHNDS